MDTRQTQILDKDSNVPNTLIDTGFVDSQVEIISSDSVNAFVKWCEICG